MSDDVCFCCGGSPCVRVPMELTYGWRPISEAPRDGTDILAWVPPPDEWCRGWAYVTNWNIYSEYWDGCCGTWDQRPTHWMPLPPPPKEDVE